MVLGCTSAGKWHAGPGCSLAAVGEVASSWGSGSHHARGVRILQENDRREGTAQASCKARARRRRSMAAQRPVRQVTKTRGGGSRGAPARVHAGQRHGLVRGEGDSMLQPSRLYSRNMYAARRSGNTVNGGSPARWHDTQAG